MQRAATTSRFLTGRSSKADFVDSEIVVSHSGLIQHIAVSHLAHTIHSQETLLKLTSSLIDFAEQAYTLRDLDALEEVVSLLVASCRCSEFELTIRRRRRQIDRSTIY